MIDYELQEKIRLTAGSALAERIKKARRDAGLTHDDLGERMGGVTRQHLIKLEKGKHRPRAEMLIRLAKATGKEIDYFVSSEGGTTPATFRNGG